MSWDIFGNPLRQGCCEVHPDVYEPWPCYLCHQESSAYQSEPEPCEGCHFITGRMQECDGTCNGITAETADQMRADYESRPQ